MPTRYDAEHIARFFDAYGEREWNRFEAPLDRVSLHLHTHYLKRFVQGEMHVLDAGAGPGRFTTELAKLGAKVTVGDISEQQLAQNRERVKEAGLESFIQAHHKLDITDLSRFEDGAFNATLCYGGPLSYVMERADDALAELLRVTQPGGPLLLSVMSKIGATRVFLPGVLEFVRSYGLGAAEEVIKTGVLPKAFARGHAMKMYTWAELEALLERHGCELLAATASNHLTTSHSEEVARVYEQEKEVWEKVLRWEQKLCAEPGNLDGGTHIITVVRQRGSKE